MQINLSTIFIEIENFIFQILFYLILFPKTFLRGIFKPAWIHQYITGELTKEQTDQFKDYMNPLYFFITNFMVALIIASNATELLAGGTKPFFTAQSILTGSVFYFILPIPFAIALIKISKKAVNAFEYRRAYYIQLVTFGITVFLCILLILLMAQEQNKERYTLFFLEFVLLLILMLWLVAAQIIIFYQEFLLNETEDTKANRFANLLRAIAVTVICFLADFIIIANFDEITNAARAAATTLRP